MFVKAGALIPQADYAMGNTGDYRVDNYTIKYFPVEGVGSEYTLFEDDCKSATSLEKDEYSLITFSGLETSESYEIKVSNEGTYTGAPTQKQLTFVIYNVDSKPRQVVVDGKKLRGKAVKYNAEASTLTITFDWNVSANASLTIVK
jgi:hypothetical protein